MAKEPEPRPAQEWLLDPAVLWPRQPPINKIDTHHHFVPDFYARAVERSGGDPSGWPTPEWSPSASKLLMNRMGTRTAILSVTAPGAGILHDPTEQAALARDLNDYAARLRDSDPRSFGFFAALPDVVDNLNASIAELTRALDVLHADGVTLFTRYGSGMAYLGNPALDPVWAELDRRHAVVFVHPTYLADTTALVSPRMPQPVVDYPHETTRTATDMITSRTLQRFRNVKVILSHAGGTLPYLIKRITTPMRPIPGLPASSSPLDFGTTYDEAEESFRRFYYDLTLSTAPHVLSMLLDTVPHDHILFGSDFPYAPRPDYPVFLRYLEKNTALSAETRAKINFGNAQSLIPRLARGGF